MENTKTAEEILLKRVGKLAVAGLKWKSLDDRKKLVLEAMREYSDQNTSPLKKRIEELEAELRIAHQTERKKVIEEIREQITSNCSDHTPFRGACISCSEYHNYDVLPMPESLIAILEQPLNPSTNGK